MRRHKVREEKPKPDTYQDYLFLESRLKTCGCGGTARFKHEGKQHWVECPCGMRTVEILEIFGSEIDCVEKAAAIWNRR